MYYLLNSNNLLTSYKFLRKEKIMKKNLVKILAIASIALAAGACNKGKNSSSSEELEELTLSEVFDLDADYPFDFSNVGKTVKVGHLAFYGYYGTTALVGYPYEGSYYLSDLKGFEVELEALPEEDLLPKRGFAPDVTVTGTIKNVNGRPVLANGTIEVDAETNYGGNGYLAPDYMSRSYWDGYWGGRASSGALAEGIFQLASVPEEVSTSKGSSFYIVFPGENTDGSDEENEYLIPVVIEDGVSQTVADSVNGFFNGVDANNDGDYEDEDDTAPHSVGDFVDVMGFLRYDNEQTFLLESRYGMYLDDPAEEDVPTILTAWTEVQEKYSSKFKNGGIPDIGGDDLGVFSYTVADNFAGSPEDVWGEDNLDWFGLDLDSAGTYVFDYNCGSAKVASVFEGVVAKIEDCGFTAVENENGSSSDLYYEYKSGDDVLFDINVWKNSSSISVAFAGIRATDETVSTWAEAKTVLSTQSGVETAIADFSATNDAAIESVKVDWKSLEAVEGFGLYQVVPTFADGTFADDDAWEALLAEYEAALVTAGFVADYEIPLTTSVGYYNATSGEFVEAYLTLNSDKTAYAGIEIDVFVVSDASKAANHLFDISATSVWTIASAANFVADAWTAVFGAPTVYNGSTYYVVYKGGYYASARADVYNYFANYVIPSCASAYGSNPVQSESEDFETTGYYDYDYYFFLATETEGTYVQLDLYFAASDADGTEVFYPYIYVSEYTPS